MILPKNTKQTGYLAHYSLSLSKCYSSTSFRQAQAIKNLEGLLRGESGHFGQFCFVELIDRVNNVRDVRHCTDPLIATGEEFRLWINEVDIVSAGRSLQTTQQIHLHIRPRV